jgi:serine/threonine protein phosphatase PrpC
MGPDDSGKALEEIEVPEWLKLPGKSNDKARDGSSAGADQPPVNEGNETPLAPEGAVQRQVGGSPVSPYAQGGNPYPDGALGRDEHQDHPQTDLDRRVQIQLAPSPEPAPDTAAPSRTTVTAFPEPPVISKAPKYAPFFVGALPDSRAAAFGQAVPDTALDGADLADLTVRGVSLRGDRHRYLKEVRQDAMGMWEVTDDHTAALLVCAADGVSSNDLSHAGAAEACRLLRDLTAPRVSKFFRASRDAQWVNDLWEDLVERICSGMTAFAAELQIQPKQLSTTLVAALVEANPPNPQARRYVILNVGDARAFLLHEGKFISCLPEAHARSDAITSTATSALPTSVGQVHTASGSIGQEDMLMVCSDGMSDPMVNSGVCDTLAGWWGGDHIPSVPEYGWQVAYRIATYDDDRTAVCVWGRGR